MRSRCLHADQASFSCFVQNTECLKALTDELLGQSVRICCLLLKHVITEDEPPQNKVRKQAASPSGACMPALRAHELGEASTGPCLNASAVQASESNIHSMENMSPNVPKLAPQHTLPLPPAPAPLAAQLEYHQQAPSEHRLPATTAHPTDPRLKPKVTVSSPLFQGSSLSAPPPLSGAWSLARKSNLTFPTPAVSCIPARSQPLSMYAAQPSPATAMAPAMQQTHMPVATGLLPERHIVLPEPSLLRSSHAAALGLLPVMPRRPATFTAAAVSSDLSLLHMNVGRKQGAVTGLSEAGPQEAKALMASQCSKRSWDHAAERANKQAKTEVAHLPYKQSFSMPASDHAAVQSAHSFACSTDAATAVMTASNVVTAVLQGMCHIGQVQLSSSAQHNITWLRQQPTMLQLDVLAHLAARNDVVTGTSTEGFRQVCEEAVSARQSGDGWWQQAHISHASLQALLQHAHSLLPEAKATSLFDSVSVDYAALPLVCHSLAVCFAVGMHATASSQPARAQLRALGSLLQECMTQVRLISRQIRFLQDVCTQSCIINAMCD